MSVPIHLITDSQRPVFLVNSRLGRFPATSLKQPWRLTVTRRAPVRPQEATLLPKLRVQIAEFLNAGSLARLRILFQPTCVGLRYGLWQALALEILSWRPDSARFAPPHGFARPHGLPRRQGFTTAPQQLTASTGTTTVRPDIASRVIPSASLTRGTGM